MVATSHRTVILVLSVLLVAALIVVYFFVDPATSVMMPKCPFKLLTGFDCPACGSQRTLHALLHGELGKALSFNPFLVISLPYVTAVAVTTFGRREWCVRWRARVLHPKVVSLYVVLIMAWWILRNMPFYG